MTKRIDLVRETVRRFNHLPNRTIARHLINTHGDMFDQDLEKARNAVRHVRGVHGQESRKAGINTGNEDLFKSSVEKLKMPETWRKVNVPYQLRPGSYLVLSDVHVPFHEIKPLEAVLEWGKAEKVTGVLFNGDIWDCAAVSYWPTARRDFNREIEAFVDYLDIMRREFAGCRMIYKPGNHEYRLPRRFVDKMPELAESPLAAMETVVGFEDRQIEFLDYTQVVMAGKLPIIHGHEVRNIERMVSPARGLFRRSKTFSACSHCHSTSEYSTRNIHGDLMTCWSFGCLCDLQPDYNPFGNDWNWGAAIVHVEADGNFEVDNRRVMPSGKLR